MTEGRKLETRRPLSQLIGFKGKITGKSHDLHGKIDGFRLRCSLKSTHWLSWSLMKTRCHFCKVSSDQRILEDWDGTSQCRIATGNLDSKNAELRHIFHPQLVKKSLVHLFVQVYGWFVYVSICYKFTCVFVCELSL